MRKVILKMEEQEKYEVIKGLVDYDGNKNRVSKKLNLSKRQVNYKCQDKSTPKWGKYIDIYISAFLLFFCLFLIFCYFDIFILIFPSLKDLLKNNKSSFLSIKFNIISGIFLFPFNVEIILKKYLCVVTKQGILYAHLEV